VRDEPDAVLRLARAVDEGPGRLRAQGHRPRPLGRRAQYDRGIAFVAENPQSLHKVSEIYDRIAFAAVGKYNEFENLRVAGIRYADLRGYSYDRSDVSARGLANAYAQTLGTVFTQESKPYEVEICRRRGGHDARARPDLSA
jgi:proteasome alpha subunit